MILLTTTEKAFENIIKKLIKESLQEIDKENNFSSEDIEVNSCKDKKFGDFSSNIAMKYANTYKENPRKLAENIINKIKENDNIAKIEIAGPGFINFFISRNKKTEIIEKILEEKNNFGKNSSGIKSNILVEFVSANPTGPLHVGHGRGAAFGDCLSNILSENGFNVTKEYYVNDAGKQIDILTISVLQRYHELINSNEKFSYEDLYKGDYIWDIAAEIHRNHNSFFFIKNLKELNNLSQDEYIACIKKKLTNKKFDEMKKIAVEYILTDIKQSLNMAGIKYNSWFLESSLLESENLKLILDYLSQNNYTYVQDNALWFKSQDLGDEKDRVLVKENKDHTYLSTDIAYHKNKIERNFDKVINIWGADHHGYISRIKGAFQIFERQVRINCAFSSICKPLQR